MTINGSNGELAGFVEFLQSLVLDRPVVEQTGLKGRYDFHFAFTPGGTQFNGRPKLDGGWRGLTAAPTLFEARQQQVDLKLEAKKTAVDVMVIDKVAKPSEK